MSTTQKPVTPDRVMQFMFSHAPTQALCAGVNLNLFGSIAGGTNTVEGLAEKSGASVRGVQLLVNALCAMGFLKKQNGKLALSPDAEMFLVPTSRAYLGGLTTQVEMSWRSWGTLTDAVKKGGAAAPELEGDRGEFFAPWVDSLFNLNFPAAQVVAKTLGSREKALDVGAGSGVWSLALAQHCSELEVMVVDLEQVVNQVTRPTAQRMGVLERYSFLTGDFHQVDFPETEFDVAFLGHILHSEGEEQGQDLMSRLFRSLKPGGTLVVAEMIPDDEKSDHMFGNLFGLNMLVHTHEGTVFSQPELEDMSQSAGFSRCEWMEAPAPFPVMLCHK